MMNVDKIQGDAVFKLFKELRKTSTPLKIQLMHGEYENLIRVADIRKRLRTTYFLIDYHESFWKAVEDSDDWRLRFEFAGKDEINYAFETSEGKISRNMIWVRFPEYVYRYQRRVHFRLDAPHGTRLYFSIKDTRYNLLVINVSLGGTLGVLVSLNKKMESELRLNTHKSLERVELVFPSKDGNGNSKVNIKKCRIKRHQKNPQTQRYECAVEFTEIAEDQQQKFSSLFYRWQRDYLRKRKLFKA
jgi:c-di-GMP-binding flagellar brake protein YcgR